MNANVFLLSIPGLRDIDLDRMPNLQRLAASGNKAPLSHHFPAVTWPSQSAMLTGQLPENHGVVANGFYWPDTDEVEMWTAWNKVIEEPQIWDKLKEKDETIKTAAWFPMLSKGCSADYVCMPAPIHKPDGSEELWCYTKPQDFYGQLLEKLGHFPLQHFWGPLANIKSTQWIVDSAIEAAQAFQPNFFYIYLPHLDYESQKSGPNSQQALDALGQIDLTIGGLIEQVDRIYAGANSKELVWLVASEYVVNEVDHVSYPNRVLRKAGLLKVMKDEDGRELIDRKTSAAWALVDHQFSHVFVRDNHESNRQGTFDEIIEKVVSAFQGEDGISQVLAGSDREELHMNHERSGDVILVSNKNSWQAYYWWTDDSMAPKFASTVDIHRKPGYDPVELFFDFSTKSVPLDASLVKGSHGATSIDDDEGGILICNRSEYLSKTKYIDTDVFSIVTERFDAN